MPNFRSVVSIVELVGIGVTAVAVTIGAAVIHRRGGMPLYSEQLRDTDRATRAEVWQALKVGHSGDPDIDALARRVATHTLRGHAADRWMIVFIALLTLWPMLHLLDEHPPWLTVSAQASAVILLSAIAMARYLGLRRSRRYLR